MDLFCPRSGCPNHSPDRSRRWFDYHGCYRSGGVKRQRYRCRPCGLTFSRRFGVTTKIILNRISRLARSALEQVGFAQQRMQLTEDLVADGLQNYCVSQDFPCDIQLLAGKESHFLYDSTTPCSDVPEDVRARNNVAAADSIRKSISPDLRSNAPSRSC